MLLIIALLSYLMGSLSFAILLSRWCGLPDPREKGSRNPGASNILRLGHKRLALLVLVGDGLKAIIPLLLAKSQGFGEEQLAWLAVAACLGHMFPIFFHLRGGKGIATALGGLLVVSWPVATIAISIWGVTFLICHYAALASLVAVSGVLISTALFCPPVTHMPIALMVGILLARHSSNWARLWKGTESKIQATDHL
jgi:acyl phosphate:glycerol-3-phosphate acyltransferase